MTTSNSENTHYSSNSSSNSNNNYQLHQHHFYTNQHNRSDLTLHKVSAIQIALDDNKSPTFAESFEPKLLSAVAAASSNNSSSSSGNNGMASGGSVTKGISSGLAVNGAGSNMGSGSTSASGSNYIRNRSTNSSAGNLLYRTRSSTPSIMLTGSDNGESRLYDEAADGSDSDPNQSLMATSSLGDFEETFIFSTNSSNSSSGPEFDHDLLLRYGWAILLVTWTIVLAGITSMLGLWDEPRGSLISVRAYEKATGYPIQGYYSCLVFMVFIASWVWCTTSWVGMKFFRHTKGGLTKSREATTGAV